MPNYESWERELERHPDKIPSANRYDLEDCGDHTRHVLEIRGLGAMVIITDSPLRGILRCATFTTDEIMFET